MVNNKKGISAIVATVLIILITVAAVTIIWAAIIPLISNQLDKGTVCLDAISQLSIETQEGYTCYVESAADNVTVQVKRGSKDFELAGIQVLVSTEGNTNATIMTADLPGVNGVSLLTGAFVPHGDSAADVDKIEIAPIVKVGTGEEICEISSAVEISLTDCP